MITLSEFLYDLEFEYKKINDKTIQLIDLLGANLGNIDYHYYSNKNGNGYYRLGEVNQVIESIKNNTLYIPM